MGALLGNPYNKDQRTLGSVLGPPIFGGSLLCPRGSAYLVTKELRFEDHIHCGFWDLNPQ